MLQVMISSFMTFAFTYQCIPAACYKHIAYFDGNRKAYDAFYDLQVDIGEIGVESFATMAQTMMVEYVREHYGDKPADWAEEYWTGERWRICICHARYLGCNNNMGIEVGFRDIKAVTPSNAGNSLVSAPSLADLCIT